MTTTAVATKTHRIENFDQDAPRLCGWIVSGGWFEDMEVLFECTSPAHDWKGGWACEAGHYHEPIEVAWQIGSRTHIDLGRDW